MSQENVENFNRGLGAYNRRDLDALMQELDADVEWHPALDVLLGGERTVFRGHEGVRESIQQEDAALAMYQVEISEIRDLGDSVLALGRARVRGKKSRVPIESPFGVLCDYRNGKTVRLRTYLSLKEALEAAGLRK